MSTSKFQGQLKTYLAERLPQVMRPAALTVLDRLPRTSRGKVDKAALPTHATRRSDQAGRWVAPRDELRARTGSDLRGVTSRLTELESVTTFSGSEVTRCWPCGSSPELKVAGEAGCRSRRYFRMQPLSTWPNVCGTAETPGSGLIVPLNSPSTGRPLFLFHPAGGTVFCYQDLARELSGLRTVYGVQAQGLDGEQPIHRTVSQLVAAYVAAIQNVQPEGPYSLGGWSLGGNIAYAVAVELANRGETIEQLAIIDAGIVQSEIGADEELIREIVGQILPDAGEHIWAQFRDLSRKEQVEFFRRQAERGLLLSAVVDQTVVERAYRICRYNIKAFSEYTPALTRASWTCTRHGSSGRTVSKRCRKSGEALVAGGVTCHLIEGRHLELMRRPQVAELARQLHQHWMANS